MRKSSPSDGADGPNDPLGVDSSLFAFEASGDEWMEHVRSAEAPFGAGRIGPFEVVEEVRRGAQGVVYRARQPGTGRTVALKRLIGGVYASSATLRRFEREVEAASALNHPGIVTIYGLDRHDGLPLLSMEWVDGRPITEWARAEGRTRAEILDAFRDVCDAVQHAHRNGVLHRDLKPSNVLVDPSGRPRVLDFGLAKLIAGEAGVQETATEGFVGTPAYASPEQFEGGASALDVRSDVYSLGVVLFELLTGRRPFDGSRGLRELTRSIAEDPPPRPSSLDPTIGRELDTIVLHALEKDRDRRYQSAHALGEDVRRYLVGEPLQAHPPSLWYHLRKGARRNPLASFLLVALLVTLVAFAAYGTRQASVLARERDEALRAGTVAERERERAEAVARFFLNAMVAPANPAGPLDETSIFDVLEDAARRVDEDFADRPDVEHEIRRYLARGLLLTGRIELADVVSERMVELGDELELPIETRALSLRTRAEILAGRGRAEEGLELLGATLAALEAEVGPAHEHALYLREAMAIMLAHSGSASPSVDLYREIVAGYERLLPSSEDVRPNLLNARRSLGVLLTAAGRYHEAERLLLEVEAEARELLGDDHFFTGAALHARGMLERYRGRTQLAEELLRRALAILAAGRPSGDPQVLEFSAELALVLGLEGECEESLELFEPILASMRSAAGERSAGALRCMVYIGRCQRVLGELDAAEATLAEVVEASRAVPEAGLPVALPAIVELARVHLARERPEEAAGLLRELAEDAVPAGEWIQPVHGRDLFAAADLCARLDLDDARRELELAALRTLERAEEPNEDLDEARARVAAHGR